MEMTTAITPGLLMVTGGAALLILAALLTFIRIVTAGFRRKRMERKILERYELNINLHHGARYEKGVKGKKHE